MNRAYLTPTGSVPGLAHPTPSAIGTPGLVQGGYGSRGNLELLLAEPIGGLTVCWFNSDRVDGPVVEPSIPAATWSAGLHVPAGPCTAAAVVQTKAGPDFVEVVASGPTGLERWTWSPGPGFARTDAWPDEPGLPYVAETASELVLGQASGRTVIRRRGDLAAYPAPGWGTEHLVVDDAVRTVSCATDGTVLVLAGTQLVRWPLDGERTTHEVDVPDHATVALATGPDLLLIVANGRLRAVPLGAIVGPELTVEQAVDWDVPAEALTCAWSRMDGETHLEIVSRTGTCLRHHRWAAAQDV